MKKTRFLALVLVASIMLMGAGYAYWNDGADLVTTVSTGHLDVSFVGCDDETYGPRIVNRWQNYNLAEGDDSDYNVLEGNSTNRMVASIIGTEADDENTEAGQVINKDKLKFKIDKLYPDSAFRAAGYIQSNGTIPAKVDGITYKIKGDADFPTIAPYLVVRGKIGSGNEFTIPVRSYNTTTNEAVGRINSTFIPTDQINDDTPMRVEVLVHLRKGADNPTEEIGSGFTFTITPNFTQFNKK